MKKITVENLDGTMEDVELVNSFDVKDISRNFAILSKGEALGEGMSKVYISEVIEENPGVYKLVGITDESVWDKVKPVMKEIVQSDESVKWNGVNLEGVKVTLDSYRIIGLKDSDKDKLVAAAMRQESSFTPTEEPMIQDQPIVEVVPEIMPEVAPEVVEEVAPVMEPTPVEPVAVQPVVTPEVTVQEPAMESAPTDVNLFDIPVKEPVQPVIPQAVQEMPTPIPTAIPVEPVMPNNTVSDEVQGGIQNTVVNELDTPQKFFDKVEGPANETVLTQEMVEANNAPSYVSEDPAIIMLDNLREVVESKNEMIKALNEKINVLTEQVKNLEEARKVSEAQRVAAETTLAQARSAEMPNGGPTLTYQPPVQNYNQAA